RICVVRSVQKMLDGGRQGVIDFGHIGFVVRDGVMTEAFSEDEFVGCCVAHHSAGDIESLGEGWCSRSMVPAQVTRQLRQSRLTVCDRVGVGAAVSSELEARQLGYVNRKIGGMSSIGPSKYAVAVELRGNMKRVRIGDRVMAVIR